GFMLTANEINHWTWVGLHYQRPFSFFRNARLNYNHWFRWDFGGQLLYEQFNVNSHATFRNNWQSGTGVTWNPYDVSNTALRGAGSLRRPPGIGWTYYVNSDYRKKVYASVNLFKWWGFDNSMIINSAGLTVNLVPMNALKLSIGVNYNYNWRRQDQFVESATYNNKQRTIVGEVDQTTLRFTGRLSYNITPDLTIQYYGQPFITRPEYRNFAWVSNPLAKDLDDRFTKFTPAQISFNNDTYLVDEDKDGNTDYSFGKPDFNFVQFRSNLIIRWEYKPGSEFYLVWSQGNTPDAFGDLDSPITSSLFKNAFSGGNARNIFLVKWTYRFLK
ncbi:MAG TPA: hydrolase, partial [Chitinophagaceae bacterium]|nr:hydrolase [Chitinophagaceae bacterium]